MKKILKKIGALALAGVMVMGLGVTAFGADMNGKAGKIGEFTSPDVSATQAKTVTLYKEITAYNPETSEVNAPTYTYSYAIAPGEAGKTVTDASDKHNPAANITALTRAGVGSPSITSSIVLNTNVKLNAGSAGVKNTFPITIDFSNVSFPGAGVYRYVITETAENKATAGIKDGDISDTRYLDVYVKDGTTAGTYDIYGYVCFINNNNIDASANATDTETKAAKTEGFVATTTGGADGATTQTADAYYTFNLTVGKTVENDNYTKSTHHQFPFTVTLENSSVTAAVLPIMTVGENATQTALTAAAIAGTWTPTIADGATVKYVGIPCGTTVTIKEKNDVSGTTYASSSSGADTEAAAKNIYYNEESNDAVVNCGATALAAATENHTVTFTNALKLISPTGLALRFAPYILMFAAGIVIFVLGRRRVFD